MKFLRSFDREWGNFVKMTPQLILQQRESAPLLVVDCTLDVFVNQFAA